jgi:putative transposase
MSAECCVTITKEAIFKWGSSEIFNTHKGVQFTSYDFVDLIKESNVKQSMDGEGRAIDNIFIKRFWRTIKYE